MNKRLIIGIMGGGTATPKDLAGAETLGRLVAENGWALLNGGRNVGIMEASARGASVAGGLTIGILPDNDTSRLSDYIQIPVVTGMGDARNAINVLSSDIVVACPGGAGTISEIALALKSRKPVILFGFDLTHVFKNACDTGQLFYETEADAVIRRIELILSEGKDLRCL